MKKEVLDQLPKPVYSRVILPLKALLEGEFFNEYIKKGKRSSTVSAHGLLSMYFDFIYRKNLDALGRHAGR